MTTMRKEAMRMKVSQRSPRWESEKHLQNPKSLQEKDQRRKRDVSILTLASVHATERLQL